MNVQAANRYAKALFHAALEKNLVSEQLKCFEEIAPLWHGSFQFLRWVASPQVPMQQKSQVLGRCTKSLSDPMLMNFFLLLQKKGRLQLLPQIAAQYQKLAAEKMGLLDVRLISAAPIDENSKNKLKQKLQAKFDKKPIFHEEIDPSLIAGKIVIIGSRMIDLSVRGKLARLKKHLLRGTP